MAVLESNSSFRSELIAMLAKGEVFKEEYDILLEQMRTVESNCNNEAIVKKLFLHVFKIKELKVKECEVPSGILPDKYKANLYDVRLGGYGPDDKLYCKDQWIRENVTRGMTFLKLEGLENSLDLVIYSNKKFMGGIGDEDHVQPENNEIWKMFCLQNPGDASHVISMSKINGEAGHISGRIIDNEFYWILGSKNVHLIVKTEEEIDKYCDQRFQIATIVAKAAMKLINSLPDDKLTILKQILHQTKMTAVFELTQPNYQHIVNLSHLTEPCLTFLMFTPNVFNGTFDSFTAIPPHHGLIIAELLGFPVAKYDIFPTDQVSKRVIQIRECQDAEGEVLYYVTKELKTIGLAKVKCGWYVMLRALREKADYFVNGKGRIDTSLEEKIASCVKRFKRIKVWLHFDEEYLISWSNLGESFMRWLDQEVRNGNLDSKKLRPDFPTIWDKFLLETESSDRFHFK